MSVRATATASDAAAPLASAAESDAPVTETAVVKPHFDGRAPSGRTPFVATELTAEHLERNASLVSRLRGQVILAPLTKGNNLPFRRLCADFGAAVTTSEMGFARHLIRGDGREKALLRRAPNEALFGVQIATNQISEGIKAGLMAAEAGADWVDLNCGCPIYEATRRGLGSALLRKPQKLARLVAGIAAELPVPLTVKIRTSAASEAGINLDEMVAALAGSGAAAVTVHGRTAMQRYKKPADWSAVERVAREHGIPVIGNGDIGTHYEAARRLRDHGCLAVMVGRGALIKPWIFREAAEGRPYEPTAEERVGIYRRLVGYMKEHFGADDIGKNKAFYFLPWHLGFLARYRPLPEAAYGALSLVQPLISTRWESVAQAELGESLGALDPLERLLRCEADSAHGVVAEALWEAGSDEEAVAALRALAAARLGGWEAEVAAGGGDDRDGNRDSNRESEG